MEICWVASRYVYNDKGSGDVAKTFMDRNVWLPCSRRGLCIDGVNGNGKCACNSPFNGTACEQCMNNSSDSCPAPTVDCKADNGGCHVFAICSQTAVDRLTCSCKPGYHGDGYYCQMIDLCETNNGGCGVNTTCFVHCTGSTCRPRHPLSPCSQNHGGCSIHANCYYDGFEVTCGCRSGFAGDGFTCEGTIIQVLKETRTATEFYKALYQLTTLSSEATSLFQDLESQSKTFTVFVPVNSAVHIKKFTLHVMKNHILSGRFPLNNMSSDLSLTTLAGTKLHIKKLTNGQVVVNGVAHVIGDLPATNGLVHVIDQMIPTVGPLPPTTVTPTKPTEPTEPSTETTGIPTSKQTSQPLLLHPVEPSVPGINAKARKQESSVWARGAIAWYQSLVPSCLCCLIAFIFWFCEKEQIFLSRAFYQKECRHSAV
ncbi:Multiple epidermal growth factor-like domains protein 11 [Desmophyllum pertusum]|uniref:Multiple epidermal growth factor-like domains protein 11 n=1 Tax=Desmophyllum pertusum TaxID=174260 RepID=A0A9W9ZHX6_9CNID|nr:Multiple epidermal growth factor-like domains protein 11 [Desmophyllum pertusum]